MVLFSIGGEFVPVALTLYTKMRRRVATVSYVMTIIV